MNKTIKILAALLPLFITSCTNDDANVTTTPQQDQVVTLSAGITRVGESGTTETFSYDKIKVINVTRQGKGLPYYQAVFTYDTSGTTATWTSDSPLLWCAGEENTFRAVYPETADYSSFTVPTDQSSEDGLNSADWMTGEAKATLNNLSNASPIGIKLTRKMAMVVVTEDLTSCTNWDDNSAIVQFYMPVNDKISNNTSSIKAMINNGSDNYTKVFTAIIPTGNTIANGNNFCEIYPKGDNTGRQTIPLPSNFSGFEAGKKYTFTATYSSYSANAATRSAAPDNLTLVSVEPM